MAARKKGQPPNRRKTNTSTPQSRANKTSASAKKRVTTPGSVVEAGAGKGVANILKRGVKKPAKGASLDDKIKYYDAKRAATIAKREAGKAKSAEKASSKGKRLTQKKEAAAAKTAKKAREAEKKANRKAFAEREKRAQDYKKYAKKRDKKEARKRR